MPAGKTSPGDGVIHRRAVHAVTDGGVVASMQEGEGQGGGGEGEVGAGEGDVVEDVGAQVRNDGADEEEDEARGGGDADERDAEQTEEQTSRAGDLERDQDGEP